MNGAAQFRINRGYGALVEFLAHEVERFGGVCVTNAWAREIRWKSNAVEISADANGQRKLFRAEATVITVPLGILKSGEFRFLPALPEKADAMRNLEFGNVVKLILQFKSSFWEDCGFIHTLDKPIPTWWNDPRGPILTGWAGGPQADVLLKQTQPQLEAAGLEILGQTFSARKELLRDQLVASHYWNWQADPHIRGAYSYIPVKGIHLPQILAAPIAETLFFAGEATVADAQTGTVFGALESGLRAAREVLGSG
jgi:monoamine oxidase